MRTPNASTRNFKRLSKFPRFLLAPLSLLILCVGCKITFDAQTVVAPDGSVTKTTRYVADTDSMTNKLGGSYQLPAGGTWDTQNVTRYYTPEMSVVETLHIYTATQQYAPGESIPSDYVRRGKTPDHVSRNEVRLTVRNYTFIKTFDYEERFQDVANLEKSEAALRRFYLASVEHVAGELSKELEGKVSLAQAGEALHATFYPAFTTFIEGIRREGGRFFRSRTFKEELEPAFVKEEAMITQIVKALPPPSDDQADSWREAVTQVVKKTDAASETLRKKSGIDLEDEELFGVDGFKVFEKYEFKTTLSLPGTIAESNATTQKGNTLTWEFESEDFLWKDYVLRARSRIIYPGRIALAGVTVLLILGVVVFLTRQKFGEPAG